MRDDRRAGKNHRPLSLTVLRERVESGDDVRGYARYKFACGCFSPEDDG